MRGRIRRRRLLRLAGWVVPGLVGLAIVVSGLSLALVNSGGGKRWLRDKIVAEVQPSVPGLRIGRVSGFVPFSVNLIDLEVRDAAGRAALRVARIGVKPVLRSLLDRKVEVAELRVEDPSLNAAQSADGRWNVAELLRHAPGPEVRPSRPGKPWSLEVRELRVEGGRIAIAPTQGGPSTLQRITVRAALRYDRGALAATVPRLALAYQLPGERGEVSARARAQLDGERVSARLESRISGPTAGPVPLLVEAEGPRRSIRGRLVLGRQGQARLEAEALLDLPGRVYTLEARSAGARLRAEASGTTRVFALRASLDAPRIGPLRLGTRMLELRQGKVRLAARRLPNGLASVDAAVNLQRLVLGKDRLEGLAGTLAGEAQPGSGTGHFALQTRQGFAVNSVHLREVRLLGAADGRALRLRATLAPSPPAGRRLRPARLDARLPLQAGTLRPARDRPMRLRASWGGVPVQELAALSGARLHSLSGELSLTVEVHGSVAAPQGRGRLLLERGRYRGAGPLQAQLLLDATPESTRATFAAHLEKKLVLEGRASGAALSQLSSGRWAHRPLQVVARVPRASTARLGALAPALRQLRGQLSAVLTLVGSPANPRLSLVTELVRPQRGRESVRATARLDGEVAGGRSRLRAKLRLQGAEVVRVASSTSVTPEEVFRGLRRPLRLEAHGTVGPFALEPLGRLHPALARVRGRLRGSFVLAGSPAALRGQLRLRGDQLGVGQRDLGQLVADAKVDQREAGLRAAITQSRGRAQLRASLDRRGAAHATLVAAHLDLGAVRELWPSSPLADNRVTGEATVQAQLGAGRGRLGPAPSPIQRLQALTQIDARVFVKRTQLALYLSRPPEPGQPESVRPLPEKPARPARASQGARRGVAFRLERLAVSESNLRLVDASLPARPSLQLTEVALTLENLASRRSLMSGAPAVLTFRSLVERSGVLAGFATFDPLADRPLAAGRAALRGLKLASVKDFLQAVAGVQSPQGTFGCSVAFNLRGVQISGAIKPVLSGANIQPAASASWLKSAGITTAGLLGELAGDEGQGSITIVIPIEGTLDNPNVRVLPAVLGIVRNAFVVGLAAGFGRMPALVAGATQSVFTQAAQALTRGSVGAAQPGKKEPR